VTGSSPEVARRDGAPAHVRPTGLEPWDAAVPDHVSEDFLQSVVLANPHFMAAHRQVIAGALAYSQGHAAFQSTMTDNGQFFLCGIALYMDATGGLTHRRLRALMGDTGILSAGRASALLWRLRLGKFIEPLDGDTGQGLTKRFIPTRAMEDAFRARMRIDLTAIQLIEPAIAAVLNRLDEPEIFRGIVRQMGDDLMSAAVRPETRLAAYNQIASRTAGVLTMYELAASVETDDGAFPSCGVANVSVAGLARQFKVSRSHALSLLRQLEKIGFIAFDPSSGKPVIRPPMRDAMRLNAALVFMGLIRAGHRSLVWSRGEAGAAG